MLERKYFILRFSVIFLNGILFNTILYTYMDLLFEELLCSCRVLCTALENVFLVHVCDSETQTEKKQGKNISSSLL